MVIKASFQKSYLLCLSYRLSKGSHTAKNYISEIGNMTPAHRGGTKYLGKKKNTQTTFLIMKTKGVLSESMIKSV